MKDTKPTSPRATSAQQSRKAIKYWRDQVGRIYRCKEFKDDIPVLMLDLTPDAIEALREKVSDVLIQVTYRRGEIANRVLTALGITQPARRRVARATPPTVAGSATGEKK